MWSLQYLKKRVCVVCSANCFPSLKCAVIGESRTSTLLNGMSLSKQYSNNDIKMAAHVTPLAPFPHVIRSLPPRTKSKPFSSKTIGSFSLSTFQYTSFSFTKLQNSSLIDVSLLYSGVDVFFVFSFSNSANFLYSRCDSSCRNLASAFFSMFS